MVEMHKLTASLRHNALSCSVRFLSASSNAAFRAFNASNMSRCAALQASISSCDTTGKK